MLSIDPDRVAQATALLRAVANTTDDLFGDIQQGGHMSHVWPSEQRTLLEIGEELGLLASTLTYRAELARGHTLGLAGIGISLGAQHAESALYESLGDNRGFTNPMAGDLGLSYLLDNFARFDLNGDGSLDTGELEDLLADPSAELSGVDRSAIRSLTDRFIEWPSITSDDIARLIAQNDVSRLLDPGIAKLAQTRTEPMTVDELRVALLTMNPERSSEIQAVFDDDETVRLYLNGADRVNLDALLARSINLGAYSHSSTMAETFVRSLPSGADRKPGIDITMISDAALIELATVAAAPMSDILDVLDLITLLPESVGGVRNGAITWGYGVIEVLMQQLQGLLHPDHVGVPGFAGNGWTAFGASASFSVGTAIRGEETYIGVAIADVMSQSFADGNQDIAADAIPLFTEILRMYRYGPATEERKQAFLASFVDGQAELRMAAAKLFESFEATDQGQAQQLQLESNELFTIHEQTVVDDDLSFRQLAGWERLGARIASSLVNCGTGGRSEDTNPASTCEPQSGGEILTDTGALTVQTSETEQVVIPLHEIYLDADTSKSLVGSLRLDQLDLGLHIEGLPDLLPVGVIEGVRSDPTTWADDDGNLLPGSDWSSFDQRMPQITGFLFNGATDPVFAEAAAYHADQGPFPGHGSDDLDERLRNQDGWFEWND